MCKVDSHSVKTKLTKKEKRRELTAQITGKQQYIIVPINIIIIFSRNAYYR